MPNRPKFTAIEVAAMRAASFRGHGAWDRNPELNSLKNKIKDFGLLKTDERCCYCGRNQHGEFRMVIDIEHVLPKSIFVKHMFTVRNLSIACKRCNMNIKKSKIDFLSISMTNGSNRVFKSDYYKFIHPNLDNYDAHLFLVLNQRGRHLSMKYSIVDDSEKGRYTYKYFNLEQLEKNSFDLSQGGRSRPEIANPNIRDKFNQLQH